MAGLNLDENWKCGRNFGRTKNDILDDIFLVSISVRVAVNASCVLVAVC